jgi:hypothetical protein
MDKLNFKIITPQIKIHRRDLWVGGFSTIEIMIAMMIILLTVSATIFVSFGNQSMGVDSATNAEAININQKTLESMQALARKDFKLVNSSSTTETSGALTYTKQVTVTTDPFNTGDYFTKKVKSVISWPGTYGRTPSVSITSLVTNFENAIGGDTCDSNLSGNWALPTIKSTLNIVSPVTSIDAYKKFLYVTVGSTANKTDPTLFVFNISDPANPLFLGSVDNASTSKTNGLSGVRIIEDTINNKKYALVSNAISADFTTCTQSVTCAQLQIFDVTNPSSGSFSSQTPINLKISNTGDGGQAVGNSIFYRNGYVYLGLTTGGGPEFNIIDVHNPLSPYLVGTYNVGDGVNTIYVSGNYAYLGSPNTNELIILDISNPTSPTKVGSYNASTGSGHGKSVYVVGDKLYLGKTTGAGADFHILNNTNPASMLTQFGSGLDVGSYISVNAVIVRDYLTFLLDSNNLQILNTSSPGAITSYSSPVGITSGSAMDCEGNNIFAGNDFGNIYTISP